MKKLKIVYLIVLSFILFISCSTHKMDSEYPYGSYSYKSFNITGELVGDGSIYINRIDSVSVEGNWAIRNLRNCNVCGPQYGNGYLNGKIVNDSIFINLNPDNPENYVELVGEINDGTITGDWRWFEMVVNSNRGTFKAIRM